MMNYYQLPPPPALEPYVRYFWVFDARDANKEIKTYKIVADGAPGLVFQFSRSFQDVHDQLFPYFFLYGQSTRNACNTSAGSFRNIGVVLQPDALRSVFGIDAFELTDSYVDADLLQQEQVSEQLLNSKDVDHCMELLGQYLLNKVKANGHKSHQAAVYASGKLLKQPSAHQLKQLQQELQLSERSLERLFRAHIGMSPKLFARVARFQASLTTLRKNGYNKLSDISYGYGYADQSHFIREFREFAGVTPNAWLKKATEVVENYPEWKI